MRKIFYSFVAVLLLLPFKAWTQSVASLTVANPTNGTVVQPGQTLAVEVMGNSLPVDGQEVVIGDIPFGISQPQSAGTDITFKIVVPDNIQPGTYALWSVVRASTGDTLSRSVVIKVLPNYQLSALSFDKGVLALAGQGSQSVLSTFGYSGGERQILDNEFLSFTSADPTIATVDANGVVTAVAAGKTTVSAAYGTVLGSVTVYVGSVVSVSPAAATPVITPQSGSFSGPLSATISAATLGSTIYYTTDGTAPTITSSIYVSPILVGNSETIKATAIASGYTSSQTASAVYTIAPPPAATISWSNPAAMTYGVPLSVTQLNATTSVPGRFTYAPAAGTILPAGTNTLTVNFTPTDTIDYATSSASVQIVVNRAVPSLSWSAPSAIVYGTALGAAQLNASSNVAGTFSYSPPTGTVLNAGPHTLSVTFTPNDASDYSSATATVPVTVTKSTPTISWPAVTAITYGNPLSAAQLDATASVPGLFIYTPAAGTVLPVGVQTLSLNFTPTDFADMNGASSSASLTVNTATLKVIASNASRAYGTTNPTLSAAVVGAVNGDSIIATATTSAILSSPPGSYPITATASGTSLSNYSVTSVPGTLTVTTAATTAILSVSASTVTIGSTVKFTASVNSSAASASPTGTVQFQAGNVVLGSAPVSSGTAAYSVSTLGVGSYSVAAVYSGDTDFSGSISTTATLVVAPTPDFTVTANPSTLTVKQGDAGSTTITVASVGSSNSTVTFSCGGLPAGTTCSFSPSTVVAGPTAGSTQLAITTTSAVASLRNPDRKPDNSHGYTELSLGGAVILVLGARKRRFRRSASVIGVCSVLFSGLAGCGTATPSGSSTASATPKGSYSVSVTVVSSSPASSHTVPISLTVD